MKKELSCGMLFKQIYDELEKRVNNALRSSDLTMAQMGVLLILRDNPEKQMPLKEVERTLRIAQSTTAGIVSRLEQKDFIEAFGQADDKRIKVIRITASGEQYCLDAEKNMAIMEQNFLSGLTDSEKDELLSLLRKVHSTAR